MLKKISRHLNRRRKKGFTLIECIVSIAIFAIMATMFASFMIDSVRVVNLSVTNDEDRELLLEAMSSTNENSYTSAKSGRKVTIEAYKDIAGATPEKISLEVDFGAKGKSKIELDNEYVIYTTEEGNKYCIYVGTKGENKPPETGFDEGTIISETGEGETPTP